MRARRNKAQRAFAAVAALTGVILLTSSAASSETSGAPAFTNGTAAASAYSVKVNPTAAALSIGVTFGTSLAGYTNEVAKAESRGIDLGIIGTTLAGAGCDGSDPSFPADQQPQPLSADSRDADAAAGKSTPESIAGNPLPTFTKTVQATAAPLGDAITLSAPVGQPGLFQIAGARAEAKTHVLDGKTREAIATSDINSIDIAGGAVKLTGLHWEAVHHTGADSTQRGTFTMGSLVVGGVPVPFPAGDPGAAFGAANTVLNALGIELRAPTSSVVNGGIVLSPMSIAVVPNATRDAISGGILGGVLPVRQALTDALLAQSCKNGTYITIADIAVGSITGAGSFSLELGGVAATTGDVQLSSFLNQGSLEPGQGGVNDVLGTNTVLTPGDAGIPGTPAIPGTPGKAPSQRATVAPIAATTGTRGGKLALLAGGTLLLLAGVAELDRRKMRRALAVTTPTEA
jgi:hypothetical protein